MLATAQCGILWIWMITGKFKMLMWPALRQYFKFGARQYFTQPDTTHLHATLFFRAGPKFFWVVQQSVNQYPGPQYFELPCMVLDD